MPATATVPAYTYTVRQLAQRDEMVFKSVVRVLQGKTRHNWMHTENPDADLVLIGDQMPANTSAGAETIGGSAVIHISATAGPGFNGLTLPLRIGDVIAQMDTAGDVIGSRGGHGHAQTVTAPLSQPAALAVASHVQPYRESVPADMRVSLSRWPEATLLQRDIRYLKLATVMTGQPVSIAELAARTQFPIQLCQGFVDALKACQMVRVIGELREVQTSPHIASAIEYANKPRPVAPSQHGGLIARIRSRLEMIVGTAAAK
jgi:hypothetical protein